MAAVYEAHDPQLDRTIALKILPPEFLHDGTFERRFEQEARTIAKLEHPNIVPIYASGIDEVAPWMSMRLLAGGNLGTFLERHRPAPREATRMLRLVADALDYAHARGVVHRDIKPTNLLLDGAGGLFVGDFGLARMLEGDHRTTQTGALVGTPHYMAPERALGKPADHRSDIYSLGIVAYEMLMGTVPFSGDSPVSVLLKHVNEPLPAQHDARMSRSVFEAVQKAVAKDPAERWPSAGAFVGALETALGAAAVRADLDQREGADRRSLRSRVRWAGAAAIALSASVGLTWWIVREPVLQVPPPPSLAAEQPIDAAPADAAPITVPIPPAALGTSAPPEPSAQILVRPQRDSVTSGPVSILPTAAAPTEAIPTQSASPVEVLPPQAVAPPPVAPVNIPPLVDRSSVAASPQAAIGDVVTQPVRLRTVSPEYPAAARVAQIEGDVLLQAVVGPDGRVRDVTVLRSVHPLVDDAARRAVSQYEYTPGQRNGTPEPVTIRLTVSFRLN